jgi:microcystin-dependent protein
VWGHSVDGVYADPAAADGLMDGGIGPAGTNQPHENMPPYLVINYVIALEGASPSPD